MIDEQVVVGACVRRPVSLEHPQIGLLEYRIVFKQAHVISLHIKIVRFQAEGSAIHETAHALLDIVTAAAPLIGEPGKINAHTMESFAFAYATTATDKFDRCANDAIDSPSRIKTITH